MQDDDPDVFIFYETLIKHIGSKVEKGKNRLKWNGTLTAFKDFVSLVLDEKGKWSSRSQASYNVFTFEHEKKKFSITWWSSSKTFIIQGEEKYSDKIQSKIQGLLKRSNTSRFSKRLVSNS